MSSGQVDCPSDEIKIVDDYSQHGLSLDPLGPRH